MQSTRLNIVNTNAAVFPVPDWDCPIILVGLSRITDNQLRILYASENALHQTYGSERSRGKARSCILEGLEKSISYKPFNNSGDLLSLISSSFNVRREQTYKLSSSKDFALYSGELESACWFARVTLNRHRQLRKTPSKISDTYSNVES